MPLAEFTVANDKAARTWKKITNNRALFPSCNRNLTANQFIIGAKKWITIGKVHTVNNIIKVTYHLPTHPIWKGIVPLIGEGIYVITPPRRNLPSRGEGAFKLKGFNKVPQRGELNWVLQLRLIKSIQSTGATQLLSKTNQHLQHLPRKSM